MYRQLIRAVGLLCVLFSQAGMPVCAQSRLDSLQHLDEVVVTVRRIQKEVIPMQELSGG